MTGLTESLRPGEHKVEFLATFVKSGPEALARMNAEGRNPAHGGVAARARGAANSERRREAAEWDRRHQRPDPEVFKRDILPGLRDISLGKIMKATGFSRRYCSITLGPLMQLTKASRVRSRSKETPGG